MATIATRQLLEPLTRSKGLIVNLLLRSMVIVSHIQIIHMHAHCDIAPSDHPFSETITASASSNIPARRGLAGRSTFLGRRHLAVVLATAKSNYRLPSRHLWHPTHYILASLYAFCRAWFDSVRYLNCGSSRMRKRLLVPLSTRWIRFVTALQTGMDLIKLAIYLCMCAASR